MTELEKELGGLVFKLPPLGEPDLTEAERSEMRKEYVNVLAKHKALYHFDEQAEDIVWDDVNPSPMCLQHMNCLTGYLYNEELFDIALAIEV